MCAAGLKVEAVVAADSLCSGKAVDYTWACTSPSPCTILAATSTNRRVLSLQSSALAGTHHGDAFTLQVRPLVHLWCILDQCSEFSSVRTRAAIVANWQHLHAI
jgi:hypothetical protein